jgi:hypothetical protein
MVAGLASLVSALIFGQALSPHRTTHLIWVMTDGLRWQEVFGGADPALMTKDYGVSDIDIFKKEFWRDSPEDRRALLMPFLWNTIARNGQIYGNRNAGSDAWVTNGFNFSYPGYNEALTGVADPAIDSNDKKNNPNVTLPEWLHHKAAYRGKIAAFAAWDVFPYIFNAPRADFPVNAGYDAFEGLPGNANVRLLNELKTDQPRFWDEEPFDNLTFHTALEYLKQRKPRVLYLSLGETDDWAHGGKYPEYLRSAHRADQYLQTLWNTVQAMPEYRNATTLVFMPDHGRGSGEEWKGHGKKIPESKYIWMAFLGPDTAALGERKNVAAITQNQAAATVAALLGEDYRVAVPGAGPVIADVVGRRR